MTHRIIPGRGRWPREAGIHFGAVKEKGPVPLGPALVVSGNDRARYCGGDVLLLFFGQSSLFA